MKTKELKKRILKENKECLKMFKVLEKKLRNINKICKNQEYEVSGYILQEFDYNNSLMELLRDAATKEDVDYSFIE